MKNQKKGFTLIEIIVVIAILAIVGVIFSVNMVRNLNSNRKEQNEETKKIIIAAANTYVSANPEKVEKLYEGYGYVDIYVRDLKDEGLINKSIKDAETGEEIPDDEAIRVQFDEGDLLDFVYPITSNEAESKRGWALVAKDINETANPNSTKNWCSENTNKYRGLYDGNNAAWPSVPSKLYLTREKDSTGELYNELYYGSGSKVNLTVENCNVNIKKAGTYQITYAYTDPELGIKKTGTRNVNVVATKSDLTSLTKVTINNNSHIIRGIDEVSIRIEGLYRDGSNYVIDSYIKKVNNQYIIVNHDDKFRIENYSNDTVGQRTATISPVKANSDGSYMNSVTADYNVITDVYTATFNANGGNVSQPNKSVTYNKAYGTLPTPNRTGYKFDGWFTTASGGIKVTSSTTFRSTSNVTLYAHWTPYTYNVKITNNSEEFGTVSTTSLKINYNETATFNVTAKADSFLSSISCTGGYIVSDFTTGLSSPRVQTVTVKNNANTRNSTCTVKFETSKLEKATSKLNFTNCDGNTCYLTGKQTSNYISYNGHLYEIYAKIGDSDFKLIYSGYDQPFAPYGVVKAICGGCCNINKPYYYELGISDISNITWSSDVEYGGNEFNIDTMQKVLAKFKEDFNIRKYTVPFTSEGSVTGNVYISSISLLTVEEYNRITNNGKNKRDNFILENTNSNLFWLFDSHNIPGGSFPTVESQAVLTNDSYNYKTYSDQTASKGDIVGKWLMTEDYVKSAQGWPNYGEKWMNVGFEFYTARNSLILYPYPTEASVRPTIQLHNVKISGGTGSRSDPFTIN